VLSLASVVLAQQEQTPLHQALSVLPGFERLTARSPERAMLVLYLWPALLAGTALTAARRAPRWPALVAPALAMAALVTLMAGRSPPLPGAGWLIATIGLLALHAVLPRAHALLSAMLVLVVYADLRSASRVELTDAQQARAAYELQTVDLADYYRPTGAARFLQAMQAGEDFRYVGYAGHVFGGPFPYTLRWADPGSRVLEVNNRALLTGLDDVQGYDPIHIARYDRFVAAMNGREQNYHHADVFDSGLDSPLLDLLNVRYLVMPAVPAPDQTLPRLSRPLHVVFQDDSVTVFENLSALPQSWIVHDARQVDLADSLDLLARRAVDPRRVALLEDVPPEFAPEADLSRDRSTLTANEPEHLRLHVETDAPGLLMLSEIYYPAWRAYVDGQPVRLYVTDAVLRAVPLPAGEHDVELRYESLTLAIGLIVSLASSAGLAVLGVASALERRASCG
jgi:Bacterial membrane protein YfhO